MAHAASVYVHIPFCARVCPYCDFAVVEGRDELGDRYLDALLAEIGARPPWCPIDSVFVGGGTPSRFGAYRLGAIIEAIGARFGLSDGAEVTLEANPEDWTEDLAGDLHAQGFNRVSFGAQSFDPDVLTYLGRQHSGAEVEEAVGVARDAGFRSISLDLIFGSPGESLESWRSTVERALTLEPDHVSCYALTVERGTPLGRSVASGAQGPDGDVQADEWILADELLSAAGLVRYEVSNWARSGHHCVYNLSVWGQGEYEAFGNGAHGFRDGVRYRNVRRLDAYLDRIEDNGTARAGEDPMTPSQREVDRVFVGLRRTAGVASGPATRQLTGSPDGQRLMDAGVIAELDNRLVVTNPLLADEATRALL